MKKETGRLVLVPLAAVLLSASVLPAEPVEKGFFNGVDLTGWQCNEEYWRVENGVIIGEYTEPVKKNNYLCSAMTVGDFYMALDIRVDPWSGNAGIQFRSKKHSVTSVHGYQADVGGGWWGDLFDEGGRVVLVENVYGWKAARKGDWNQYEILAVGNRIWIAVNGVICTAIDDPEGAREGIIAFQIHAGKPQRVQYRIERFIQNPEGVRLAGKTESELSKALEDPWKNGVNKKAKWIELLKKRKEQQEKRR